MSGPFIDPSLPLQAAIAAALKASPAIADLVGDRIFDEVKGEPLFPYISLGPDDVIPDYDACSAGAETFPMVNVWSRAVGRVEAKRILAAAILVLDQELEIEGHRVISHEVEQCHVQRDPKDPLTKHGVLVVRYATQPVA